MFFSPTLCSFCRPRPPTALIHCLSCTFCLNCKHTCLLQTRESLLLLVHGTACQTMSYFEQTKEICLCWNTTCHEGYIDLWLRNSRKLFVCLRFLNCVLGWAQCCLVAEGAWCTKCWCCTVCYHKVLLGECYVRWGACLVTKGNWATDMVLADCSWGKNRLGGQQSRSGRFSEKRKIICTCRESNRGISVFPFRGLAAVPTGLSWFPARIKV